MKLVEINSVARGSTGTIMINIAKLARSTGNEAYTFSEVNSGKASDYHIFFGNKFENIIHRTISVFTGISGKGSVIGTKKLLKQIDAIKPDILHLHNLHGWYINLPMLFNYIKDNNIKTVWTLHDCWGFTAQCSHFTMEKCDKWKTGCYKCPRYKLYPYTFVDRTKTMWRLKKEWFSGIENLTIVTPSQWLADLAKKSFLGNYPIKVINNGIDLGVFKPTESSFRPKYNLESEKIVLGVASGWNNRKGLDIFIELSKTLPDEYKVILVGTDDSVDKVLPKNILSIHRTQNQQELAEIYTVADVFVNPTREENFPTVNIEALACGTPVVTFNTGGSAEIIDIKTGISVECGDVNNLVRAIYEFASKDKEATNSCINRGQLFSAKTKYLEYINLFERIYINRSGKETTDN